MKKPLIIFVLGVMTCVLCSISVSAQKEEEPAIVQFRNAYQVLVDADNARDSGSLLEAVRLYKQATMLYKHLSTAYPDWQPGVVKFRTIYCNNQLDSALKKIDLSDKTSPIRQNDGSAGENNPMAAIIEMKSDREKNEQTLVDLKDQARTLLLKGKPAEARTLLMTALKIDPDDSTIRILISIAQCDTGNFTDAVFILKQLLNEDSSNANAHLLLGTAYFGLGRFADSEQELKRALAINPRFAAAHYDLAQVMLLTTPRDINAARQYYKSAVALGCKRDKDLERLLRADK